MPDRRRSRPRQITGTTGAARILEPAADEPEAQGWHDQAWEFRDVIGELRFAEMWLGNSFSRSRLFAATRAAPGAEPEPVETGPAADLMQSLAGGVGGLQEILRQFGTYLLVPGLGYLVGEPTEAGGPGWAVWSADEIQRKPEAGDSQNGSRVYQLREGPGRDAWRDLSPATNVVEVLRPHPRRHWEPDSPTRAALPILGELDLLTQHVAATATSRLAGAGIQAFPTEMEFEGTWEQFIDELIKALTAPIKDRSRASAVVPYPIRVPGNMIKWLKDGYIRYSTPFDEQTMQLREEAIQRLGNAMDMPRQVLTGEARNHWGDWQVEETGIKIHVEPGLALIGNAFTVGFLWPGLERLAGRSDAARRDIEAMREKNPDGEFIVWYDTSDLRVRPDRSNDAQELYDRWEAGGDTYRKEAGLSEASMPDPTDPMVRRRLGYDLFRQGGDFKIVAQLLGIDDIDIPEPTPVMVPAPPNGQEPPPDEPVDERTPPDAPPDEPAAPADETPGDAASIDALIAACDGLVFRALERAGNRYLRLMKGVTHERCDLPAADLYLCDDDTYHLRMQMLMQGDGDRLFDGAWDRVAAVADMLDEDAPALTATLDAYVRTLVRTKTPHSWDTLATALGACQEAAA